MAVEEECNTPQLQGDISRVIHGYMKDKLVYGSYTCDPYLYLRIRAESRALGLYLILRHFIFLASCSMKATNVPGTGDIPLPFHLL